LFRAEFSRTGEGRERAELRGVKLGRKPKLSKIGHAHGTGRLGLAPGSGPLPAPFYELWLPLGAVPLAGP
jgi:hypothetical protein